MNQLDGVEFEKRRMRGKWRGLLGPISRAKTLFAWRPGRMRFRIAISRGVMEDQGLER
jgi:hypothetical protein